MANGPGKGEGPEGTGAALRIRDDRRRRDKAEYWTMQQVMNGYRAISLLVDVNWDRLFTIGTVVVGLLAGAFLGSALSHPHLMP